jgi:hypothetical protein
MTSAQRLRVGFVCLKPNVVQRTRKHLRTHTHPHTHTFFLHTFSSQSVKRKVLASTRKDLRTHTPTHRHTHTPFSTTLFLHSQSSTTAATPSCSAAKSASASDRLEERFLLRWGTAVQSSCDIWSAPPAAEGLAPAVALEVPPAALELAPAAARCRSA